MGGYNAMPGDLHVHTTASDGLLSPTEVLKEAVRKGLSFIAITDHDTTAGIVEAIEAAESQSIMLVPGIEMNTEYKSCEVHILGYFIDISQEWFQKILKDIRDSREKRAKNILEKLKLYYNIDIPWEIVKAIAGPVSIGRPHIARAMLNMGFINDVSEAFDKYLSPQSPAYEPRYKLLPEDAINYIKKLGGIAVLAHPGLLTDKSAIFYTIIHGIEGLEVYHTKHDLKDEAYLKAIADHYDLIPTGGSDFHGDKERGNVEIGSVRVADDVLEMLRDLHVNRC